MAECWTHGRIMYLWINLSKTVTPLIYRIGVENKHRPHSRQVTVPDLTVLYRLTSPYGYTHSVETPSMVDPQWNIVLKVEVNFAQSAEMRLAVCGGQYLFTLRLPMFALSLVDFLSFCGCPVPTSIFYFFVKVPFEGQTQNLCSLKTWMGFVGQILIKLGTSSIWGCL